MRLTIRPYFAMLKTTAKNWSDDRVPILGAALSYYTIFSIAPLMIMTIAIAGLVFGQEAARGEIVGSISGLIGQQGAEAVQTMISSAKKPSSGIIATLIGFVTLLIGASSVFIQLQDAFNVIWKVSRESTSGLKAALKHRFQSFAMVLGIAFVLLVSLVVSTALGAIGKFFSGALPGGAVFWSIVNFAVSLAVISALFAAMFKELPDVKLSWRDVRPAAVLTAIAFTIGKFAIGLYLGKSTMSSAYGAAGSLVVLLVWVYYSAQIMFFGAEFSKVYATQYGTKVIPKDGAYMTMDNVVPHQRDRATSRRVS